MNDARQDAIFDVVLYGHDDCCLCRDAEAMLRELKIEYSMSVRKVDVRRDEKWSHLRCQIPVVTVDGGNRVASRVSIVRLRRAFERASQRRTLTPDSLRSNAA